MPFTICQMPPVSALPACWIKKSTGQPDQTYTYGYARYSVIGGALTALMLLAGSVAVIAGAIGRLLHPAPIHYDGMILFALLSEIPFNLMMSGGQYTDILFKAGAIDLNQYGMDGGLKSLTACIGVQVVAVIIRQ